MSSMPGNMHLNSGQSFTVTVGTSGDEYGFRSSGGSYGSISPANFVTHGGVTEPVVGFWWDDGDDAFFFRLDGIVTNSDAAAFTAIYLDGVQYLRSAGTYAVTTVSTWSWALASQPFGASTEPFFVV